GLATNPKNASFTLSGTVNTDATRLNSVINTSGCGSFVGVSSAAPGSGVVNITALNPGTSGNSITLTNGFSNFTPPSALSGGTDGTQTCPSSTSGTFVMAFDTSGLATNLAAAINNCNSLFSSTVGVTASPSTNTVTVTDSTPGAFLARAST